MCIAKCVVSDASITWKDTEQLKLFNSLVNFEYHSFEIITMYMYKRFKIFFIKGTF